MSYFDGLCDDAIKNIENYGAHDIFIDAPHDEYASYARSLLNPEFSQYMAEPVVAVGAGEEIPFR
jgi:5'(3')-deoxyribonucleotidase